MCASYCMRGAGRAVAANREKNGGYDSRPKAGREKEARGVPSHAGNFCALAEGLGRGDGGRVVPGGYHDERNEAFPLTGGFASLVVHGVKPL